MATSEGIPSSIDIEFLELNDNPYLCFVKIEKISLLDNSKLSVNVLDTIIDVDGRYLLIEAVCSQN